MLKKAIHENDLSSSDEEIFALDITDAVLSWIFGLVTFALSIYLAVLLAYLWPVRPPSCPEQPAVSEQKVSPCLRVDPSRAVVEQ